jgi:dihydroorotate dehydrogenase
MGKDSLIRFVYVKILKPIFFLFDPEFVHDFITGVGRLLGSTAPTRRLSRWLLAYQHPMLRQDIGGLHLVNPIGLAAGFDKNAQLTKILPEVGFGFAELGTITAKPYKGNPGPRLWRMPKSKSIVVNYGLMNHGCDTIAKRLKRSLPFAIPIGVSIAMTNQEEYNLMENAIPDILQSYRAVSGLVDYITINTSCPNTNNGMPLSRPGNLHKLLVALTEARETLQKAHPEPTKRGREPIFFKISPDLSKDTLDQILNIALEFKVTGVIASNLTKKKDHNPAIQETPPPTGGMSGKVQEHLSDRQISYIYKKTGGKLVIIGCGGVFTAEDAYRKIRLGASAIQMITGMIYEGPQAVGSINRGLVRLLKEDGYSTIEEAVGVGSRL